MNNIFFTSDIAVDYKIIGTNTELSWLHEECNNNETLLITVGDSWTWGDHLGNINWITQYDDPVRLKSVYGKQLSSKLNSDWILIAKPGCSNHWMLEKLKLFYYQINELKSKYSRIIITIVLTEDFREFEYNKELRYTNKYYSLINSCDNLFNFLQQAEKQLLFEFVNLLEELNVEYYITRAFTDFWPENKENFYNSLLNKTWCDVFQDEINFDNYLKVVPYLGQMAIGGITKLIDQVDEKKLLFKQNFLEIEKKITARYNFLSASYYNIPGSSWHPNPIGHEIFADYLYKTIEHK